MRTAAFIGILMCVWLLGCFGKPDAQDMVQLTGNHPTAITAEPAGPIAPDRVLKMTITVKVRNPAALDRFLAEQQDPNSPNYQKWLTPQEFAERFGPDPAQFKALRDWLVEQEFKIVSADLAQRSITFTGTGDQAERVFHTKIMTYPGGSYANVTDPSIPAQFAGVIGVIGGLDNMTRTVPLATHR
jgi:subtilase family serine protease